MRPCALADRFNDPEVHTADGVEIAIGKLKFYESPGIDSVTNSEPLDFVGSRACLSHLLMTF